LPLIEAIEKANKANDPITALRAYSFLGREVSRIDPKRISQSNPVQATPQAKKAALTCMF
jgi:hypothetical protein